MGIYPADAASVQLSVLDKPQHLAVIGQSSLRQGREISQYLAPVSQGAASHLPHNERVGQGVIRVKQRFQPGMAPA
jgi:hypothetical protein